MPPEADRVRVTYTTSPGAKGLQWLSPAQTSGRRHPFLYSNPFAINARSYIPLQDLPGVRSTYQATLRTPCELVAVMAAERRTNHIGEGVFKFRMPQPIPSYLVSFAIGELAFKATGPRSGVWAEPGLLDAAAREFSDMEQMLVAVESVYGPYRWDRYDVLIMPPAMPFGGVENPRLTFMSPTIIAGDKSLVGALAHEIAHSWSGNLVNHATWPDLWLNEGFTTYLVCRLLLEKKNKNGAD